MGLNGTNHFGNFEPDKMKEALSKSGTFKNDLNLCKEAAMDWSGQMMHSLPIGFPKGHLVCHATRNA